MDVWGALTKDADVSPPPAQRRRTGGAEEPAAAAAGGAAAKKEEGQGVARLAEITARLSLKTAREMRMVLGFLMVTLLIPVACPCLEAMAAARKKYEDKVRGNKGHKEGRPDGYNWGALVHSIAAEMLKDDETMDGTPQALIKYLEAHPKPTDFPADVAVVMLSDCYDSEIKRLTLRVEEGPHRGIAETVVERLKKTHGATEQVGGSARGHQERALQDELDRRKKKGKQ